jgi:selenocysteine-specific elongation factor
VIIGTAGHIDHGKSALIEALTGVRMDRLREERERGITIDLNFAPLPLGDGRVAGVVDVPGHEDFVRTMVAGASGMDLLLLVIAADEGIKPQTREHLAIAEQLGIPRGIPVITKSDLVETEWLELLTLEIAEWLSQSPVNFSTPLAVSSLQGTGLHELKTQIAQLAESAAVRPGDDLFRLPIDRAFSVAGIGTVITGTAWSGVVALGDTIRIMPAGIEARIRSIEVHGTTAAKTIPGMRTALGLAGTNRDQLRRGDVAVALDSPWLSVSALDGELRLLPSAPKPLTTRTRIRVHLGTAELIARVYPREKIEPGGSGQARLTLEAPTIARTGDRLVLRSYSPVETIGGGVVLDPIAPRRGAGWSAELADPDPAIRLRALVGRRPAGVSERDLLLLSSETPEQTRKLIATWKDYRRVPGFLIPEGAIADAGARAGAALERYHQTHPSEPGMSLGELRQTLHAPGWLTDAVLADLHQRGAIVQSDGLVRAAKFRPSAPGGEAQVERVIALLERSQLTPPSTEELARELDLPDISAALRLAHTTGRVLPVERERYYARSALDRFVAELKDMGRSRLITPSEIRDRLGLTRKYVIPLLEWADRQGITVRIGEGRRLREVPLPPPKGQP